MKKFCILSLTLLNTLMLCMPVSGSVPASDNYIDFNKNGRMDVYENPQAPLESRIEDLISQMNLNEKTCQMATLYGYLRVVPDQLPTPEWKEKIWKDGMGAIDEHLNGFRGWGVPVYESEFLWPASAHARGLNEVQRFFVEETRLGIPVDFTNEGIRGVEAYRATNFPTQLGLGHTWDRGLIHKVGYITGREARLLGYTNVYAPILDVGRDQRWGRYEEVYGEDPYLVAELGVEMVKGMQKDYQVASTGKHFIAYSNNKGGREGMSRVDPQMAPHEVENIHVYPWREVIGRAGMLGVMSSYNDYDGYPIQSSKWWLEDRLRKDFGFQGYVVSDSDAVEYLHSKHHVAENMKESVYQSVMAGLNVRCTFRSPDSYILPLRELVKEGRIPMSVIDDRVRDILRVKFMTGLFDNPYQTDFESADKEVDGVENNKVALQASRESIVLLKNKNNILPLDASRLEKIAVIGPNADEVSFTHTHYGPLATRSVSLREGLETALAGKVEVSYSKGCELVDKHWPLSEIMPYEPDETEMAMIREAVATAQQCDVAIVAVGGGIRTCGENKSRTSIDLPGYQELLLREIHKTGKPMIVVLINGRPLAINWAAEYADAILEAWYPGSHGGTALAEVLLGDYNPGGKLTVTFPKTAGQIPFNFPAKPNSQIDGPRKPGLNGNQTRINGALYNFGFGLSYTTFEYSDLELSDSEINPDESIQVSFTVKNTGKIKGDEVVQLYIRDCVSSITTYEKLLKGFDRITLEPQESRRVTMTLTPKDLALLDEEMRPVVEPGEFKIMIGASSTDIRLEKVLIVRNTQGEETTHPAETAGPQYPVFLERGDELTLPLDQNKNLEGLNIRWTGSVKCEFEILISDGGGQFLPVLRAKASRKGEANYRFDAVKASEVRISILNGKAGIGHVSTDMIDDLY